MPEPLRYLAAVGAALLTSALVTISIRWLSSRRNRDGLRVAGVVGMAVGAAVGLAELRIPVPWPPTGALERWLVILLPVAVIAELAMRFLGQPPSWLEMTLHAVILGVSGRVLLHGSVYLRPELGTWSPFEAVATLVSGAILLFVVWWLLDGLTRRSAEVVIPLSLAASMVVGGMGVMMAGYLRGGAVAFPLAAALAGSALATQRNSSPDRFRSLVFLGVMALFGVLFIGRYFGSLDEDSALAILLAPVAGWGAEWSRFARWRVWQKSLLRCLLVSIPLAIVLLFAKQRFDREMRPLLGGGSTVYGSRVSHWPPSRLAPDGGGGHHLLSFAKLINRKRRYPTFLAGRNRGS